MSQIGRARILKADAVAGAAPVLPVLREATRRRVARDVVDASLRAQEILGRAAREAEAIVARAREEASGIASAVATEAREREVARLAAAFVLLRAEDERRAERDLDRAVALARVLSERLLGHALTTDPDLVVSLARQALAEARGARRAVIEASPLDAEALRRHVEDIGLPEGALEIKVDPSLSAGSLRLHTNLGSLDAQLTPQLERLAEALRDALA